MDSNWYPFCVVERPFQLWGHDVAQDNIDFLTRVDAAFYWRAAHQFIGEPAAEEEAGTDESDAERKDVASLARLLWHHGAETLVMMVGAYMQAPGAVHGYFLKCRTEDAITVAKSLAQGERLKYDRLVGKEFSLTNLLSGIHRCAGWSEHDERVSRLCRAFRSVLRDFIRDEQRHEYNSIKHGLRAHHGRFAMAVGIQEAPGIPAPPEAMEFIGGSRDASFFDVARPLQNATKQVSKINFKTDKVSVAWSLEKAIAELQLISILLNNCVSALRICNGAGAGTVQFQYVHDDESEAFWDTYFGLHAGNVSTASMGIEIDARQVKLAKEKDVFASYKSQRS